MSSGVKIQLRRDTGANWTTNNSTLAQGEMGFEYDSGRLKVGDGSSAWNSLSYEGSKLTPTGTKTSAYTAKPYDYVLCDVSSGTGFTVTLPTAPPDKTLIGLKMIAQLASNSVTIASGGSDKFNSSSGGTSIVLQMLDQSCTLQYQSSTSVWHLINNDAPVNSLDTRYGLYFNVKSYGAVGDGVHDDTSAIQTLLTGVAFFGGGTVFFPVGNYLISSNLTLYANTIIIGAGGSASTIVSSHTGSAFVITSTVNGSTAVQCSIQSLAITNSNGSNTGCAINDNFGTYWVIEKVYIQGFAYGIALNQTEEVSIRDCIIYASKTAGIWLTNGPSSLPGSSSADYNYTNLIVVESTYINPSTTAACILDDGGQNHYYNNVGFEGGNHALVIAGSVACQLNNAYIEGSVSTPIVINTTTSQGHGSLLPTRLRITGGTMSSVGGTVVTGPASEYLCGISLHDTFLGLTSSSDYFLADPSGFPGADQFEQSMNYIYGSGSITG